MRIDFLQNFIDTLRNKNLNNTKFFSNNFIDRLKVLLKERAPYHYDEKKYPINYIPNYSDKVWVDKSVIRNFKRYKRAFKHLKTQYDIKGLEWTYNNLEDEFSKEIFLKVLAYRIYDDVKLRFPIYYSNYVDDLERIDKIIDKKNAKDSKGNDIEIKNLSKLGSDIDCIFSPLSILYSFILDQYNYKNFIKVEDGDYVIDGGACTGDSTLSFISKAKNKGRIFAFEFLDENLEKFHINVGLNPKYNENITLIKKALWSDSKRTLYAAPNYSGTMVSDTKTDNPTEREINCISIDDFVNENKIEKIDFIKMDIEGSELNALIGARETITKFRPKLAICIYHKNTDLWQIPRFIKELVPEYKLYINHYSINVCETVLYATTK